MPYFALRSFSIFSKHMEVDLVRTKKISYLGESLPKNLGKHYLSTVDILLAITSAICAVNMAFISWIFILLLSSGVDQKEATTSWTQPIFDSSKPFLSPWLVESKMVSTLFGKLQRIKSYTTNLLLHCFHVILHQIMCKSRKLTLFYPLNYLFVSLFLPKILPLLRGRSPFSPLHHVLET